MAIHPTPRMIKREENQQKISQAAMALYQTYSFEEVTVADICQACGLSVGSFYNLFGSKENTLFLSLAVSRDRYIEEQFHLDDSQDFFSQFHDCVMASVRFNYSVPKALLGNTYSAYVMQKVTQNLLPGRPYVDTLMGVIRRGCALDAFTFQGGEQELFRFCNAFIIGIAQDWCAHDAPNENELCELFAEQIIRTLIKPAFLP